MSENDKMRQSKMFSIFCHNHTANVVAYGCIEHDCENNAVMCERCFEEDESHSQEHKSSILPFSDYLQYIAHEISKLAAPTTSYLHKNV